ncbi:MAG: BatA and WFA domain-containing protein [Bacteroidetes bacterium]|nr:BatA and WFA domain-containing protein [Bacteroidota bacterium]
MHFGTPAALWALLLLAIPVLVHLFHFRRYKTILFSNVRFLKNLETERKNQNRLKHLLVLTARCLALACLVLAFAQPGCNTQTNTGAGKMAVSLFIDNSYSMEARNSGGILFETARQKAREIVKSLGDAAVFQIQSQNPEGRHLRFVSASEAVRYIDELQISAKSITLEQAWARMQESLQNEPYSRKSAFVISDFQTGFVPKGGKYANAAGIALQCLKLDPPVRGNLSLDTAWVDNPFPMPGEKNLLRFRISNYTSETVSDLGVRLTASGELLGIGKVTAEPWSSGTGSISFTQPEAMAAGAVLQTEDPEMPFDNQLYLSPGATEKKHVSVTGTNSWCKEAMAALSLVVPELKAGNIAFPAQQAWFITGTGGLDAAQAQELVTYIQSGGTAVLAPSISAPVTVFKELEARLGLPAYTSWRKEKLGINRKSLSHPFFQSVFSRIPGNMEMPAVLQYLSAPGAGNGETILSLENGDPVLLEFRNGAGRVYVFTTALEPASTSLVQSALFLPVVANCIIHPESGQGLYAIAGSGQSVPLPGVEPARDGSWILKLGGEEFVPELGTGVSGRELYIGSILDKPGIYNLKSKEKAAVVRNIALNASRRESDPRQADAEVLQDWSKRSGAAFMKDSNAGLAGSVLQRNSDLWRLFIWLAAVFFATEVLLLVFWDKVNRNLNQKKVITT